MHGNSTALEIFSPEKVHEEDQEIAENRKQNTQKKSDAKLKNLYILSLLSLHFLNDMQENRKPVKKGFAYLSLN